MSRGRFFAVEGGEGSGKTTCISSLQSLSQDNIVYTREPGGTKVAEEIRRMLLRGGGVSPLTEFFLFNSARAEHMSLIIEPAIESGKHVVTDRFDGSTYAYQIAGRQNNHLKDLFSQIRKEWKYLPEMYVFFDVDPVVGLRRRRSVVEEINEMDKMSLEFHRRVREGFLEFLASVPHVVIDANRPLEEVNANFTRIMKDLLA